MVWSIVFVATKRGYNKNEEGKLIIHIRKSYPMSYKKNILLQACNQDFAEGEGLNQKLRIFLTKNVHCLDS